MLPICLSLHLICQMLISFQLLSGCLLAYICKVYYLILITEMRKFPLTQVGKVCYPKAKEMLSSETRYSLLAVKAREPCADSVKFRSQQLVWMGEERGCGVSRAASHPLVVWNVSLGWHPVAQRPGAYPGAFFAARPPRRGRKEQERWNNPNGNRIPWRPNPLAV